MIVMKMMCDIAVIIRTILVVEQFFGERQPIFARRAGAPVIFGTLA